MKKFLWKITLFLGTVPFLVAILSGIYAGITKFSGLSVNNNSASFIKSFCDWLILYSFVFWATYVIGAVLILVSIIMFIKQRKASK